MPREKEHYRDMMERLDKVFPTEFIPLKDAAKFCGITVKMLVSKHPKEFKSNGKGTGIRKISKSKLASILCD